MSSRSALVEAVCSATDFVRRRTRERVRRDAAAGRPQRDRDRASDDELIDAAFDVQHEQIVAALRRPPAGNGTTRPGPTGPTGPPGPRLAVLRTRPDVTLSASVAALGETVECVRITGRRIGADPAALVDVVSSAAEGLDLSWLPPRSAGQQDIELPEVSSDEALRAKLARTLLLGGASSADIRSQVSVFGLDTGRAYVAVRAHPSPGYTLDDLIRELNQARSPRLRDGLVVRLGADAIGFLATPPIQVRTGVVGVGPPGILERLAESFELATRSLDTARAFDLSGVHTFDDLGLLPTILADAEMGESLYRRYLRPLVDGLPMPELLDALRSYFACGTRVDRAAKHLRIHPNTLRHRLNRFQALTGADLNDPVVAMEVWWALAHACRSADAPAATGWAECVLAGTAIPGRTGQAVTCLTRAA